MNRPDEPGTSDRLREDIDRGRTGDKVDFPDPAAAPLGTDDEAAGDPATSDQVHMARQAELRDPDPTPPPPGRVTQPPRLWGILLLILAVILILWMVF